MSGADASADGAGAFEASGADAERDLPLVDAPHRFPVRAEVEQFAGAKWSVWSDTVDIDGHVVVRDVLRHPGAVAIAAVDDEGRILLIRQYRHPVAAYLWEVPAGLLDKPDEDPLECARRELAEEAGVSAERWSPLLGLALSPGGTSERIIVFLATGLTVDPDSRPHTGEAEERELPQAWVPIPDAMDRCLDGSIANATAVAAILALAARPALIPRSTR
ncbi:MAG: NUDIX hydrolase [Candidatus Nanopelagicales bacterium]